MLNTAVSIPSLVSPEWQRNAERLQELEDLEIRILGRVNYHSVNIEALADALKNEGDPEQSMESLEWHIERRGKLEHTLEAVRTAIGF